MTDESTVMNISHAVIQVSDLKKAVAFYQLLGFAVDRIISQDFDNLGDINDINTVPLNKTEEGDFYCVGMGLGKDDPRKITRLEIMQCVRPKRKPNYKHPAEHLGLIRIAFTVKGLKEVAARLEKAGHRVEKVETIDISPSLSSVFVHVYDPDGNWMTLMEWVKK